MSDPTAPTLAQAPAPAAAPAAEPLPAAEAEAWARVEAAWGDEAVHRAYLARFASLEEMAVAGGRYRAVLAARPDDAMARRMRDELVKRATVLGLATLPRTASPQQAPAWFKRFKALAAIGFGAAAAWAVYRIAVMLGSGS